MIKSPDEIKDEIREDFEKQNREAWNRALNIIEYGIKNAISKGDRSILLFTIEAPVGMNGKISSADFINYYNRRVEQEYNIPAISNIFDEVRNAGYELSIECYGSARYWYTACTKKHFLRKPTVKYNILKHEGNSTSCCTEYGLSKLLPDSMNGSNEDALAKVQKLLKGEGLKTEFYYLSIKW